jgi:hypothetical protein
MLGTNLISSAWGGLTAKADPEQGFPENVSRLHGSYLQDPVLNPIVGPLQIPWKHLEGVQSGLVAGFLAKSIKLANDPAEPMQC